MANKMTWYKLSVPPSDQPVPAYDGEFYLAVFPHQAFKPRAFRPMEENQKGLGCHCPFCELPLKVGDVPSLWPATIVRRAGESHATNKYGKGVVIKRDFDLAKSVLCHYECIRDRQWVEQDEVSRGRQ